jgi:hypothetical protein
MVSLEVVAILLSGISISASLFYYANVLRNQNETRQAQLYMGIINTFNSIDFRNQWHLVESATWDNYDDFHEKNPPGTEVLTAVVRHFTFFESIGSLVDKNLIDIVIIDGILALSIVMTWRKYESIIIEDREHFHSPTMWIHFETLYNKLSKREEYAATEVADFVKETNR